MCQLLLLLLFGLSGSGCIHCKEAPERKPTQQGRPLAINEVAYFATIFGPHIDYSKIRIVRAYPIREPFRFAEAYTRGSTIYVSKLRYRKNYLRIAPEAFDMDDIAVMVRELCHVWQYQKKINGFTFERLTKEHRQYRLDVYKYDKPPSGTIYDYRFEQQCKILFDYVYVRAFEDEPAKRIYDAVLEPALAPDSVLPRSRIMNDSALRK